MRKLFILLLIIINRDFSTAEAKSMNQYNVRYSGEIYEPVEPYSSTLIKGNISITSGPSNNSLRIRYDLYSSLKFGMNKSYASGYASSKFAYPSVKEITYSFKLSDIDNLARAGILVRVGVYNTSTKTYLNFIESTLYNKRSILLEEDMMSEVLVYEPCLYLAEDKLYEKFDFTNYSNILTINEYYRLDLEVYSFVYEYIKPFKVEEIYLSFKDKHNLYPYINEVDGNKIIPLLTNQVDKTIKLNFNNLFVNQASLEMSSTYKEGYIETHYLYFPINKLKELQGSVFTLNMVNGGVSNISFSFTFLLDVSHLLIGPCNESSYCIVGGVKK